jgi:hypothetical protein
MAVGNSMSSSVHVLWYVFQHLVAHFRPSHDAAFELMILVEKLLLLLYKVLGILFIQLSSAQSSLSLSFFLVLFLMFVNQVSKLSLKKMHAVCGIRYFF